MFLKISRIIQYDKILGKIRRRLTQVVRTREKERRNMANVSSILVDRVSMQLLKTFVA